MQQEHLVDSIVFFWFGLELNSVLCYFMVHFVVVRTYMYVSHMYKVYLSFTLSQEVDPMYRESDHIHISAVTQALGVNVRVLYMDRGEGSGVNHHDFPEGSTPHIHLLYRPGHYDILYS